MEKTQARVELLVHTPHPLAVIYAAFRQCYYAGFVGDIWDNMLEEEISRDKQGQFVTRILESGHTSPLEHVSFTFALSGVSRALTHQLVRHRIASYSQQSQRYVDAKHFNYVLPPAIARNEPARKRFENLMKDIGQAYGEIQQLLEESEPGGKSREDARFVLPQATAGNIVVTMNCRSLLNFFELRCCARAQWEIRSVANTMLAECRKVLPEVFAEAGAKCERQGLCPEGEEFTCGRYPLLTSR